MNRRWGLAVLALIGGASCAVDLGLEGDKFACAADSECITGYRCVASLCVDERLDAGAADATQVADTGTAPEDAGVWYADAQPARDAELSDSGPTDAVGIITLRARVHAIITADDDGQRPVEITPAQVGMWVEAANDVMAPADIELDYDPATDTTTVASTLLNETDLNHPRWLDQHAALTTMAERRPGALTVVFRHGFGVGTGGSFAAPWLKFIGMPGWLRQLHCGGQWRWNFPLMVGHHLTLLRTFPGEGFASEADAAAAFAAAGDDPTVFDGDGVSDTLPDPFVGDDPHVCDPLRSFVLQGVEFELPRDNIMNYYANPTKTVTPMQAGLLRHALAVRTGQDVATVVAGAGPPAQEGEALVANASGGRVSVQDVTAVFRLWSGAAQLLWQYADVGDALDIAVEAPDSGMYEVYIAASAARDYAVHQHSINGRALGDPVDLYAPHIVLTGPIHLGQARFRRGANTLTVRVVGSNPNMQLERYVYGLDYLLLKRPR